MKSASVPILAALAGLLFPMAAGAATYKCVALHYPPLIHHDSQHQPAGAAYAIVQRAFQQLGHTLTVDIYPWNRAHAMIRAGEADCIFTIFRSAERESYLDFSNESLLFQPIYFYARRGRAIHFDGDLEAVKGLRIGTALGVNYGPKFEQMRPNLAIEAAATLELNFKKLSLGRIDLVVSNGYTALSTLDTPALRAEADKIDRLPVPIDHVPTHIAFAKARNLTALRDAVDAQLRKMAVSGETRQLMESYAIDKAAAPAPAH